jgi:hypothetical protein
VVFVAVGVDLPLALLAAGADFSATDFSVLAGVAVALLAVVVVDVLTAVCISSMPSHAIACALQRARPAAIPIAISFIFM